MRVNNDDNFFQPVLSTLGLLTSVIATLIPLFPVDAVRGLFINQDFIQVSSASSFLLGFIVIWMIFEQQIFYLHNPVYFRIFRSKTKDTELEPLFYLTTTKLVAASVVLNIILFGIFVGLSSSNEFSMGVLQAIVYVLFFLLLITAFSLIFLMSRGKHKYDQQKINFPKILFDLLERHGHLRNTLEISVISPVKPGDPRLFDIDGFFPIMSKRVRVKILNQSERTLDCFISNDGGELIKVIEVLEKNT